LEKIARLVYKQNVKLNFMKLSFLLNIFVLFFCLTTATAQKAVKELTLADQRQIIEVLLKERLEKSPEKTIYLSTANLPEEIQKDFPLLKDKRIEFIAAENSVKAEALCAYEFGKFERSGKFVSVSFGDCNEGLAYDFKRFGDRWKSVGLSINK